MASFLALATDEADAQEASTALDADEEAKEPQAGWVRRSPAPTTRDGSTRTLRVHADATRTLRNSGLVAVEAAPLLPRGGSRGLPWSRQQCLICFGEVQELLPFGEGCAHRFCPMCLDRCCMHGIRVCPVCRTPKAPGARNAAPDAAAAAARELIEAIQRSTAAVADTPMDEAGRLGVNTEGPHFVEWVGGLLGLAPSGDPLRSASPRPSRRESTMEAVADANVLAEIRREKAKKVIAVFSCLILLLALALVVRDHIEHPERWSSWSEAGSDGSASPIAQPPRDISWRMHNWLHHLRR